MSLNNIETCSISIEELSYNTANMVVRRFENIRIGNRTIQCPFWMNNDPSLEPPLKRAVYRGGKMSPERIEEIANELIFESGINTDDFTDEELINLMRFNAIGVDCSGFTYQVCEGITKMMGMGNLSDILKTDDGEPGLINKINVKALTSTYNSVKIDSYDVLPGDILRVASGTHAIVVLRKKGNTIECAQSLDSVGKSCVGRLTITVDDPNLSVLEQAWTGEGIINNNMETLNKRLIPKSDKNDGFWRLKVLDECFKSA